MKFWILVLLAGALVGTLGDRVHTFSGVLSYPRPTLFGEPWWVLPEFALAALALVGTHRALRVALREPTAPTPGQLPAALAWVGAAYAASGLFRTTPVALAVALGAAFVGRALRAPHSRVRWLHALGAALLGPIAEALISHSGAFAYARGSGVVPVWLAPFYLHIALLARALERRSASRTPARATP